MIKKKSNKNRTGKTLEEIYGKEKAIIMKNTISNKLKGRKRGTYEERYGKEKADKLKKLFNKNKRGNTLEVMYGKEKAKTIKSVLSKARKGKTYEEIFGKEKAKILKYKHSEKIKGKYKGKTYEERYGKEKAEEIKIKISKEKTGTWKTKNLISIINNIFKTHGQLSRIELDRRHEEFGICCNETIRNIFGSTDKFAKYAGIKFKVVHGSSIGKNESFILDLKEKQKGIQLQRQYYCAGFYGDGYDSINNVMYEVDEQHHKNQIIQDKIREQKMSNEIGCTFVRINEQQFLNKIKNKTLEDF